VKSSEDFDGVSFWHQERPFILLNDSRKDGFRTRMTVLHECFHLIAHRNKDCGKLEDDQANAFASAMLMPATTFGKYARKYFDPHSFLEDRMIWGASVGAMVRRLYDLGIFSEWSYRDAFIQLQKMGWRMGEPNAMIQEESTVQKKFFEEAGDKFKFAFDLADESTLPMDVFFSALPSASRYEKSANLLPGFV
jgi:Zn-dependent peptidase ImmA (M78 family)